MSSLLHPSLKNTESTSSHLQEAHDAGGADYALADCDGKRIALVMTLGDGNSRIFRGNGRWTHDQVLGDSLRIRVEGDDKAEILIAASQWNGAITSGSSFGCERCISIN